MVDDVGTGWIDYVGTAASAVRRALRGPQVMGATRDGAFIGSQTLGGAALLRCDLPGSGLQPCCAVFYPRVNLAPSRAILTSRYKGNKGLGRDTAAHSPGPGVKVSRARNRKRSARRSRSRIMSR